jgi:peptidoglycan/xylan/chitin deacetylase (PgdA/CDA1 family)
MRLTSLERWCCAVGTVMALLAGVTGAKASESRAAQAGERHAGGICKAVTYLTLDTGNMRDAEMIADILRRHQVRATFFLANELTPRGDHSLDLSWAAYWRARAAEGHRFGSHTFDHVYFRSARADGADPGRFIARPQFGPQAARDQVWQAPQLCGELRRVGEHMQAIAGVKVESWWRAPGGRAPLQAMRAAEQCGFRHVHWADAGFLGDELPSDKFPNDRLLAQALSRIRDGDILMAHLGIWSRKDPFAPMLDPLIEGLKRKGFCFRTLDQHPDYRL